MADTNASDNTQQPFDPLEPMEKLLLRAQVLQADMIDRLGQSAERHEQWKIHDQQWKAQDTQWNAEAKEREKRLDERIERLVLAIREIPITPFF
jgi:hypothetical protein